MISCFSALPPSESWTDFLAYANYYDDDYDDNDDKQTTKPKAFAQKTKYITINEKLVEVPGQVDERFFKSCVILDDMTQAKCECAS